MTLMHFDEAALIAQLDAVSTPSRAAFAAACAERLMPGYVQFALHGRGDAATLAAILERLWEDLAGAVVMRASERRENIAACMALIPGEDDEPWIPEQALANDAAAALAYALRCRQTGDVQEAAWAARRAYEALDHFIVNREDIDTAQPGAEPRVLAHPLMQRELARQRRDLEQLVAARAEETTATVIALKQRARAEAPSTFADAS